jgi:hypothetical protein
VKITNIIIEIIDRDAIVFGPGLIGVRRNIERDGDDSEKPIGTALADPQQVPRGIIADDRDIEIFKRRAAALASCARRIIRGLSLRASILPLAAAIDDQVSGRLTTIRPKRFLRTTGSK